MDALHHVAQVMGTTISVDVVGTRDRAVIDGCVAWFRHVDETFSPFRYDSAVSRVGRGELGRADWDEDLAEVIAACDELHVQTGGVFDVWHLPSPNGTRFDPCGYVKGWAVERAARLLARHGVRDFCVNAGGDIACAGRNQEGRPWRIGVRDPADPARLAFAVTAAAGPMAIATSASYERGAHIVDPRDGRPATELASATVIGTDLGRVDALATTLYVLGADGLGWLAEHDAAAAGCVITWDGDIVATANLERYLAGDPSPA